MYHILICDDDKDIRNALKLYLADPRYKLWEAENGKEAVEMVQQQEMHLILMDIMMPVMDGITAMGKIRELSNVPVIMLSAKSEDADKILGLNIGADDYITKPFSPLEVAARVNSQLRRFTRLGGDSRQANLFVVDGIELDDGAKQVTVDGKEVALTPKEYDILRFLMKNPGKVYSPKEIYTAVWQETPLMGSDNTVAVHIRHLREKIEINPNEPRYIKVMFGRGYKVERGRNE